MIFSLKEIEINKYIEIGRGRIISRKDLQNHKGDFPVYSSSKIGEGKFGSYGKFDFDEELITWSVDGGGKLFYRPKHKFSITNVAGYIRVLKKDKIDCKYLFYCLTNLHAKIKFDWVKKAHPSVIRELYNHIYIPSITEQKNISKKINKSFEMIKVTKKNLSKKEDNAKNIIKRIISDKIKKIYLSANFKKFNEIANFKNGINFLKSSKGIPTKILGVKDFQSNIFVSFDSFETIYLEKELKKDYEIKEGDIFFVRSNGNKNLIGRSMLAKNVNYKATFSGFSIRARLNSTDILPEFLIYILKSDKIRTKIIEEGTGANISSLNQQILSNISIPIIDIKEQKKFISFCKEILKIENHINSLLYKQNNNFNEIKISLLDKNVKHITA